MAPKATDEQARAAAVAEAAASENGNAPPEFEMSNGIVLSIKPIPPGVIERARSRIEEPRPPKIEVREGIEEENPDDPEYEKAKVEYERRCLEVATNVLLLVGTEVKSIPEGMFGAEDDGWVDQSGAWAHFGVEPKLDTKHDRYLSWLELYAISTQADVKKLMAILNWMAGLGEQEVQATIANFRSRTERGADRDGPPETS